MVGGKPSPQQYQRGDSGVCPTLPDSSGRRSSLMSPLAHRVQPGPGSSTLAGCCASPVPPLTCSLYSLRLRMTAVICWSMKMRMVTRTAGTVDTRQSHHGLAPKGKMIQPRAGFVGCGEQKGHRNCHPSVGCVAQLGDRTSPGCSGWSPAGTQGCSIWGKEEHPLGSLSHQPPQGQPGSDRAGDCSWAPQAGMGGHGPRSHWKSWHYTWVAARLRRCLRVQVLLALLHTQGGEPKPRLELVAPAPVRAVPRHGWYRTGPGYLQPASL